MRKKVKSVGGDLLIGGSLMHGDDPKPDFSGYVTKAGLKCADGRVIMPNAFKHQDKAKVPLVWQHNHDEPSNVLGHVILEDRDDGVYGYAYLNDTDGAKNAGRLVQHEDINSFSIYANQLIEKAKQVSHGIIREVSLVLSGANPGALIDNITLAHSDGSMVDLEDEAIITTGEEIEHADESKSDDPEEESGEGRTIQEVYDSMDDEEKEVVHYMIGKALENAKDTIKQSAEVVQHKGTTPGTITTEKEQGGSRRMKRNVFEQQNGGGGEEEQHVLTHDAVKGIVSDAVKKGSLREAVEDYALKHGIENIDTLFPDAKAVSATPEFDARRTEWVKNVINGTKHSPFSRIKSLTADLTFEDARAKGYIKGTMKKEEFFPVASRTTTPTTMYKKQKLDRDDIIDITDFDVVAWLKAEMRLMFDEELARAILIGDGRAVDDEDKIKDPAGAASGEGIRSIVNEHELYAATVNVEIDLAGNGQNAIIDRILRNMRYYKGSGSPTFYTTLPTLTWLLLARDGMGRRYYRTASDLAAELGVANIVTVEPMEDEADDLVGVIVNLNDYTIGADKGGDVNFFDDFDIDYNQYKYLLESRLSGALTKIRSAIVVRNRPAAEAEVTPVAPDFDGSEITINDTANVVYRRRDTNAVVTSAAPVPVADGETLEIYAQPEAGYYFETDQEDEWSFTNEPGA